MQHEISRHPVLISTLLVSYILGVNGIQTVLRNASADETNDTIQFLTSLCFTVVAYVLYYHGGGLDAWPSIIPLAVAQSIVYVVVGGLKMAGLRPVVRRIDGYISVAGVVLFTALALYTAIPDHKKWARHLGVLACVVFGLPLAYAIPQLLRQKKEVSHKDDIQRALRVSELVYSRAKTPEFAEVEFVHDQSTGARCGIYMGSGREEGTFYIAFGGSDSKVDWLRTNFDVKSDAYPFAKECMGDSEEMKVHQGFLNAWKSIRERVWTILSDMMLRKAGSGRLVICGHSLGGALATLAAPDLACLVETQYKQRLSVITFGAPKVGTKEFKKAYDALIPFSSRVVTMYDPVPKIVINDFVHVKNEVVVSAPVENPVTSHLLPQYTKALEKRHIGLVIPIVGFVTLFVVSLSLQGFRVQKMAK